VTEFKIKAVCFQSLWCQNSNKGAWDPHMRVFGVRPFLFSHLTWMGVPWRWGAMSASVHHWIPSTWHRAWYPEVSVSIYQFDIVKPPSCEVERHWRILALSLRSWVTGKLLLCASGSWYVNKTKQNKKETIRFGGLLRGLNMFSVLLHRVSRQWY